MKGTKRLALKHGIKDPDALDARLQRARDEYLRNKEQKVPTKEEVKLILRPIARQAQELRIRLRNLQPRPKDDNRDEEDKRPLDGKPFYGMIQQSLDRVEDGKSLLGNLSIELFYLHHKAHEVMDEWDKPKMKDMARNTAIRRVTQAWEHLTNTPATHSNPKNKRVSDNPDNPPPKYYCGNRNGPFLDFLTEACDLIGVVNSDGIPFTPDANVKRFVELNKGDKDLL